MPGTDLSQFHGLELVVFFILVCIQFYGNAGEGEMKSS